MAGDFILASMTAPVPDLSRLRIDRDAPPADRPLLHRRVDEGVLLAIDGIRSRANSNDLYRQTGINRGR